MKFLRNLQPFPFLQQVMEIMGISQNAALVALRRTNMDVGETVTKLATDEPFLKFVNDEAARVCAPCMH